MPTKRGRKSASELTTPLSVLAERRPEPPADLPDAAASIWVAVAGCMPGDWFRPSTQPLLKNYALATARAMLLDQQINQMRPEWLTTDEGLARMDALLRMRDRLTKEQISLARSMRLTQQAQMHPRSAGRAIANAPATDQRPWD